jgi:hypothetical protein
MEEELDEFGIPINPADTKSKPAKPKAVKEEVDEFGIPLKKKGDTTPGSEEPAQPSTESGAVDPASIERQQSLLYQAKKLHKSILDEANQALNDSWDADYTEKHFSDKQALLNQTLDQLDNLGGDDIRQWTAGMRSAVGNTKNNIVAQRASALSFFSDPENLYEEDKGNQEWFGNNVREIEGILSGRQVNKPVAGAPKIKVAQKQQPRGIGEFSLAEIVQKPKEEMFVPDKYGEVQTKLAEYENTSGKYQDVKSLTKNIVLSTAPNGDVFVDDIDVNYDKVAANKELWQKYVGNDIPWPGENPEPNATKRYAMMKEVKNRILKQVRAVNDEQNAAMGSVPLDKLVEENFNSKTYAHFLTQADEAITQPTVDAFKLNRQVKEIIEHYGMDPDGYTAEALYAKAKAAVQFESDRYNIEEKFKEEHPEEYALRDKYQSGKFQEEINAKFVSQLESTFNDYQRQANEEADIVLGAAKKKADEITQQYTEQVDQLKQQAQQLGEAFQGGQLDEMTYQSELGKINEQFETIGKAVQDMLPKQADILSETNKIYSRYNSDFERRKAEMIKATDAELKQISGGIPEADLKKINDAYSIAYGDAFTDKNNELYNQLKMTAQASVIPLYMFRRSFMNGVGSYIKSVGSYFDSQNTRVFGEAMQNEWSMAAPRVSDLGFNMDDLYYNMQNLGGSLAGNMAPGLLTTALATYATGGAAAPEAMTLMAGWLSGWVTDTMSIAGQNGQEVFDKTGDIRLSQQAVDRSIDTQQALFLTYALDGLPLTKGAYRMIPSYGRGLGADIAGRLTRGAVGAGIEVGVETFLQEIPQNIFEENIINGVSPTENFADMYSAQRIKETLVGVAPIGLLGFAGGARTKSRKAQAVDDAKAFEDKATLIGGFEDQRRQYLQKLVFDKDDKYARSIVSAMVASGHATEDEAAVMQEQITHAETIKKSADDAKLNNAQRNVYGFFSARADEARRNADKNGEDPILEKMYRQQQSEYERAGSDYLQGKSPDMLTLTYLDGTTMMMTPEDARNLSKDKDFLTLLAKERVSVQGFGNTKPVLDEMQESVNNHTTKSAWKAAADRVTGITKAVFSPRQVEIEDKKKPTPQNLKGQQQVAEQVYNNTADLTEATKMADNFLSTVISNPLWSNLDPTKRDSIKSIAAQNRALRQKLADNPSDSNEYNEAKRQIEENEQGIYNILNGKVNDQENIQGVSGEVGVGQEPVTTQPVEGAGTETTQAGGVLQAQEEVVSEDPRERVLQAITEQDFIDNAPAITTPDIERIKSQDGAKQQAKDKAVKEAKSAFDYLDGKKTAKEFLADNGYDVEGMSDEEAKKFADSDVDYWKNKLAAEETKGGKKPTKGKKQGKARTPEATIAQKEQEMMDLLESGVQASQDRIKQLIAQGMTPDQAYEVTEKEWLATEEGKRYKSLQEEVNKTQEEKRNKPQEKRKKAGPPKMPEVPTSGQQRVAAINALEQMIYEHTVAEQTTGQGTLSLEELSNAQARLAEAKKQSKQGGLTEVEIAMKKALGEKVVTLQDVDKMVREDKVETKCPPGKKKAENGIRMGFIPGGKWDVVKEFKGKSHANGGIDVEISGGKINYTGKDPKFKAKNGAFWNTLRDVGYGTVDTALGAVGSVAGIKSMQDIIDEDQYRNDKFDAGANFAGKLAGNALKVIPVTAPISAAVGAVGGIVNQVGQIDAKNYDESQHTSTLDKVGSVLDVAGSVAGMAVTAGVASNAAKTFEAGDKLSAAHKMSMRLAPVNRNLGNAAKAVGGMNAGQQPTQPVAQPQAQPIQQPMQQPVQPMQQMPGQQDMYQQGLSASGQPTVTINGVNYVPDQYGNLIPLM